MGAPTIREKQRPERGVWEQGYDNFLIQERGKR